MRAEVEGRPFGLTLAETTDVGVQKQLVVYIKVKNKQHFVGLVTLKAGDAASVFSAAQEALTAVGCSLYQCAAFSSDGASVMRGLKNEVKARIDQFIAGQGTGTSDSVPKKMIFSCHCVLHRVNLSLDDVFVAEGASKEVAELADKIEILMKYCYKFFSRSPERREA